MLIDIRTLILILGISHLMQILVFYYQYKVNKLYKGVGWWLLWSGAETIGFAFVLVREIPSLLTVSIIFQNNFIIGGIIFIYIGIMRFFGKKENLKLIISVFSTFEVLFLYFLFINDDVTLRSIFIALTLAVYSFLIAYNLFKNKTNNISSSVNFIGVIFILHGVSFVYRFVKILSGADVTDIFSPSIFNIMPFADALVASTLWTFGFIIMLNHRLNAEMSEAKEHFEEIFTTSPDGVAITRVDDGMIVDINSAYESLTGYTKEETMYQTSISLNYWKNLSERDILISALREKGVISNYESVFIKKDGSEFFGSMSAKVISLKGIPHVINITRDITDHKNAEKGIQEINAELEKRVNERTLELEKSSKELNENQAALLNIVEDLNEKSKELIQSTQMLEAANKELEAFSYSVSHDLRSPLRALDGFAKILLEDYSSILDSEGKRYLKIITDNATNMGQLIDDLLAFSRLSRQEIQYSKIDMQKLAKTVYEEIVKDTGASNVEFKMENIAEAFGDNSMVRQIWRNLISNAVKFSSTKEKQIIEIGNKTEGSENIYYVKDNGVGFDIEYKEKLFGVFQRLHSKNEFEGTGVGLAIVQRITHRLGGRVWAEGKVNEGATFYFTLLNNITN